MWNRQCLVWVCLLAGAWSTAVAKDQQSAFKMQDFPDEGKESNEYQYQLFQLNDDTLQDADYAAQLLQARRRLQPKSTKAPSIKSTKAPTIKSTKAPSVKSTKAPSVKSTKAPSVKSTKAPSVKSTKAPSVKSTRAPSVKSTKAPTITSKSNIFA